MSIDINLMMMIMKKNENIATIVTEAAEATDDNHENEDNNDVKQHTMLSSSTIVSTTDGDGKDEVVKKEEIEVKPILNKNDKLSRNFIHMCTGGMYIPPAKLRALQSQITDKNSIEYQQLSWEVLKKSLNSFFNKLNLMNISAMVRELFKLNLVRARGLLCRSIMQRQASSPAYTNMYAALIAIINIKLPNVGELLMKRLIVQFRRSYRQNDKSRCITTLRFIAHLINQNVIHYLLALQILIVLLEDGTNDSVEIAIAFIKEVGAKLDIVAHNQIGIVYEALHILHSNTANTNQLSKRVKYMMEKLFTIQKDKYKTYPVMINELKNLVGKKHRNQNIHIIDLGDENIAVEEVLNRFQFDPNFQQNEFQYETMKQCTMIFNADPIVENKQSSSSSSVSNLRQTIDTIISTSSNVDECMQQLDQLKLQSIHYVELCNMIVDACAENRITPLFCSLLAQNLCSTTNQQKLCTQSFMDIFKLFYKSSVHFEPYKIRGVGKFFGHLLYVGAIPWNVLDQTCIDQQQQESTTTDAAAITAITISNRIFMHTIFQHLTEMYGKN